MDMTNLYLLIFPASGLIKVGKADDVHVRIQTLQRTWGAVDYAASYYLRVPKKKIFNLEKALQCFLEQHAASFTDGDGKTELFSIAALQPALEHLQLFCSTNPEAYQLVCGIPYQLLPTPQAKKRRRQRDRLLLKSRAMVGTVSELTEKFGRINRLLTILYRRQSRIPFEYGADDNGICFRVRSSVFAESERGGRQQLMNYFSFRFEDLNSFGFQNCCRMISEGGVTQFMIDYPTPISPHLAGLVSYFMDQTRQFLNRLPQRSAAATTPIPPIDENGFWRRFSGE